MHRLKVGGQLPGAGGGVVRSPVEQVWRSVWDNEALLDVNSDDGCTTVLCTSAAALYT